MGYPEGLAFTKGLWFLEGGVRISFETEAPSAGIRLMREVAWFVGSASKTACYPPYGGGDLYPGFVDIGRIGTDAYNVR
jgi:hypothetical protein